jgi:hypothetical protein
MRWGIKWDEHLLAQKIHRSGEYIGSATPHEQQHDPGKPRITSRFPRPS